MRKNSPYIYSLWFVFISLSSTLVNADYDVIWAVNCGGPSHRDSNGIEYAADFLTEGIASDYGVSFTIGRVPIEDQIIYQTERYHTDSFSYTVPYFDDGDYVLVLKFSEVWFADPNQKVFHVQLNKELTVIENLDIFAEVGFATALEKLIPIQIRNGVLSFEGDSTQLHRKSFTVDFIKTSKDNPKVNAIVLAKGSVNDVPQLPPPDEQPERRMPPRPRDDDEEELTLEPEQRRRPPGSPRAPDPYASTDYSYYLLPVLISVAAFLPVLICLCRI